MKPLSEMTREELWALNLTELCNLCDSNGIRSSDSFRMAHDDVQSCRRDLIQYLDSLRLELQDKAEK